MSILHEASTALLSGTTAYKTGTKEILWQNKFGSDVTIEVIDAKTESYVERGYWDNGKLHYEYKYQDGKEHGLFKSWHYDGKLWYEDNYRNGVLCGVSKEWQGIVANHVQSERNLAMKKTLEDYKQAAMDLLPILAASGNFDAGKDAGKWAMDAAMTINDSKVQQAESIETEEASDFSAIGKADPMVTQHLPSKISGCGKESPNFVGAGDNSLEDHRKFLEESKEEFKKRIDVATDPQDLRESFPYFKYVALGPCMASVIGTSAGIVGIVCEEIRTSQTESHWPNDTAYPCSATMQVRDGYAIVYGPRTLVRALSQYFKPKLIKL